MRYTAIPIMLGLLALVALLVTVLVTNAQSA